MNYQATLESGEQITVGNQEAQTRVQVQGGDSEHRESQGTSLETGTWKAKPQLFQTEKGAVLQVDGDKGSVYLHVQDGALQRLDNEPQLDGAKQVSLHETKEFPESPHLKPMAPMKPMKPMEPLKPL
jgi:hypothetical protein